MSEVVKIPLRLVKTTYHITTQNTTKFLLQSICHMKNACSQIIKNLIASVKSSHSSQKSVGCWKIIKMYPVPSTFIVMNIAIIYCAYKITTNSGFRLRIFMLIAAREETLKYSIIPSKTITSSVLFDDSQVSIFTRGGVELLQNDNTRNLILSEELDANIQKPFPRGEPVSIKIIGVNGLLDNGKLTLKTAEDSNKTLIYHHTLSLEIKKTSTTSQDEIAAKETESSEIQQRKISKFNISIPDNELSLKTSKGEYKWPDTSVVRFNLVYSYILPITENFSFSFQRIVKIQADDSDEVFYFKQNVNFEYDRKLDGNLQNRIIAKELSGEEEVSKTTFVEFDSGTVVFKTQDGKKIVARQRCQITLYEGVEKIYLYAKPYLTLDYV
ncbi:hypothetical protein HCN44_008024 [Aphidius gifuensis]|uniref:Uncharacterized protein n=1 Tax=Aphidius gifuensis TaxID=684658 RepID=A0A834XPZ5_APHGI|nr:uncharacterized protein LOC122857699 [Aphidius gifuensis]KAF7989350.1 hypothetical protein HCN44_008024 [Aphidius gifuensis]